MIVVKDWQFKKQTDLKGALGMAPILTTVGSYDYVRFKAYLLDV